MPAACRTVGTMETLAVLIAGETCDSTQSQWLYAAGAPELHQTHGDEAEYDEADNHRAECHTVYP